MFSEAMKELISTASILWKVDPDSLSAVIEVESSGKPLVKVMERHEPTVDFNKHHFYRRLSGAKLETAVREGLALPHGKPDNAPVTQPARWRLLARAAEIDRKAAYESTSWGVGRILGAHWAWLGFGSVDALVREARSGPHGQLNIMMRYIEKADLARTLWARDWERFALCYRGPTSDHVEYCHRLAQAYSRHSHKRYRVAQRSSRSGLSATAHEVSLPFSIESDSLKDDVQELADELPLTSQTRLSSVLSKARTWIDHMRFSG